MSHTQEGQNNTEEREFWYWKATIGAMCVFGVGAVGLHLGILTGLVSESWVPEMKVLYLITFVSPFPAGIVAMIHGLIRSVSEGEDMGMPRGKWASSDDEETSELEAMAKISIGITLAALAGSFTVLGVRVWSDNVGWWPEVNASAMEVLLHIGGGVLAVGSFVGGLMWLTWVVFARAFYATKQ